MYEIVSQGRVERPSQDNGLKELMLETSLVLRFQSQASPEDVSQRSTLLGECVDNRRARRRKGSLLQVSK